MAAEAARTMQTWAQKMQQQRGRERVTGYLEAGRSSWGEAVFECASEGIEHDALAGGFRQVGGQVTQQDGGVGPDGGLLIHLHDPLDNSKANTN